MMAVRVEKSDELIQLFHSVEQELMHRRQELNLADSLNGNHGDHMVQIFQLASQAAEEKRDYPPADAMQHAAILLQAQAQNGSAQVYARGLSCMAEQFRKYQINSDDLVSYVQKVLAENRQTARDIEETPVSGGSLNVVDKEVAVKSELPHEDADSKKSGKVLKALVSGLANWGQVEDRQGSQSHPLDMGSLFEFGFAYLQAKQRNGSKIEVLADAAVSVSPLSKAPHRYQSGRIAIQALLQAMQSSRSDQAE